LRGYQPDEPGAHYRLRNSAKSAGAVQADFQQSRLSCAKPTACVKVNPCKAGKNRQRKTGPTESDRLERHLSFYNLRFLLLTDQPSLSQRRQGIVIALHSVLTSIRSIPRKLLIAASPQCLIPLTHLSQPDSLFRCQHLQNSRFGKGTKANRGRLSIGNLVRALVNQRFIWGWRFNRFSQRPLCLTHTLYGGLALIFELRVNSANLLDLIGRQVQRPQVRNLIGLRLSLRLRLSRIKGILRVLRPGHCRRANQQEEQNS
jgi:hypothetical protein